MNELSEQLRHEISGHGPLSFAEFMRRALYDPANGYYNRSVQQIGRRGDFFTSVSVGSFFGELLAFQFARWMEKLPWVLASVQCVEAGAHDGRLAFDVLDTLEDSEPALFAKLQYWIVEPSQPRRYIQQRMLERFRNIRWFNSLAEISGRVWGVIFSNEWLDAMPVHIFRWNAVAQHWNELGVGVSSGQLTWVELPWESIGKPKLPGELLSVLPDGYIAEMSMEAIRYWHEAAMALAGGKLMTIDYGGTLSELLSPARTSGTLRAYSGHRLVQDILKDPGEQDITAHVNFSEIRRIGKASGLKTETFTTQSQFLSGIARKMWTRTGSWPQHQVRQFQTLTHPEHLGRPFRVLVQSR
jgi:SAM-dependent MidA family methyltransferase